MKTMEEIKGNIKEESSKSPNSSPNISPQQNLSPIMADKPVIEYPPDTNMQNESSPETASPEMKKESENIKIVNETIKSESKNENENSPQIEENQVKNKNENSPQIEENQVKNENSYEHNNE